MRNSSSSSSVSNQSRERSNSCASTGSSGSGGGGFSANTPICRIFTICDIVKTGQLYIKRPPTSGSVKIRLKTWQKRYFVLRDQSYQRGTARLEIYNTESAWHQDRAPSEDCLCVDLHSVAHVDEYNDSKSYPNAFTVSRTGHAPLVLGADSEYDLKEWMVAIQVLSDKVKSASHSVGLLEASCEATKDGTIRRPSCPTRLSHWNSAQQLHSSLELVVSGDSSSAVPHISEPREKNSVKFLKLPSTGAASRDCLVTVETTEDSARRHLQGEYYMIVLRAEIFLQRPGTLGEVITWPLSHIIKLKSEDQSDGSNLVTLEASSLCGRDSGRYLFTTCYGRQIIQKVKDALSRQSNKTSSLDEELERLRVKPIARAPSSPDLLSRCSPPRLAPREHSVNTTPDLIPQQSRSTKTKSAVQTNPNTSSSTWRSTQSTVRKTYSLDIPITVSNDDDNDDHPGSTFASSADTQSLKDVPCNQATTESNRRCPELPDDIPDVDPPDVPDVAQKQAPDLPPEVPSRDRKPSNSCGKRNPYLMLIGENESDASRRDTCTRSGSPVQATKLASKTPTRSSPNSAKRKLNKLPPLPPNALDRTSPPKSSSVDIPPSLPRRRSACSPPLPPPRPQHTLGTNSSPVR